MLIELPTIWIVLLNVVGWAVLQFGLAWAFSRMPVTWFNPGCQCVGTKRTFLRAQVGFAAAEFLVGATVGLHVDLRTVASLLRTTHELRLFESVAVVKQQQVEEAQATCRSLEHARELAQLRRDHYASLLLEPRSPSEKQQLDLMMQAAVVQLSGSYLQMAASTAHQVPEFTTGYMCLGGSATARYGGSNIGRALEASAWYLNSVASLLNTAATQSSILAGYQRRREEWDLQQRAAEKEIQQADKQIIAAEIRLAIAEHERDNHALQTEQAEEVDDYLRRKFTSEELYDWTVSQLATLYFQSHQLAYAVAKRPEACYRHEQGVIEEAQPFIQFGYWDNLKRGLLAGENLHYDLKRMETAYLDLNRREYELTKHVSLLQLDPLALIQLRTTGSCTVQLPEELFDLDGPGHYFRRIKTVAVSVPCVVGSYASVNCKLTLEWSRVRIDKTGPENATDYPYQGTESRNDPRFLVLDRSPQTVVTSSAQSDSGLFETSLRDERYLPFENHGVISQWRLELPANPDNNNNLPCQFDYDTIADVVLHIRYTARDKAVEHFTSVYAGPQAAGFVRLFSVRHEFPTEWARFRGQTPAENGSYLLINKPAAPSGALPVLEPGIPQARAGHRAPGAHGGE